jgi:hypothetical protein
MSFDWSAYRKVAETLSREADEASQRSAISRASTALIIKRKSICPNITTIRSPKISRRTIRFGANSAEKGYRIGRYGTKATN